MKGKYMERQGYKLEGMYQGVPFYSHPACPPGFLYCLNDDALKFVFPKRKDGKPDMRYGINRLQKALDY